MDSTARSTPRWSANEGGAGWDVPPRGKLASHSTTVVFDRRSGPSDRSVRRTASFVQPVAPKGREQMITLYAFKTIFEGGVGETKDLRAQWAPRRRASLTVSTPWHQLAGDLQSDAYSKISPFHQVPVHRRRRIHPLRVGRRRHLPRLRRPASSSRATSRAARVSPQWCFGPRSPTVDPTFSSLDQVGIFDLGEHTARERNPQARPRWLDDLERCLADRAWIACGEFTVADVMMAGVLRNVRKTDLLDPFPKTKAYRDRCSRASHLGAHVWRCTLRGSASA